MYKSIFSCKCGYIYKLGPHPITIAVFFGDETLLEYVQQDISAINDPTLLKHRIHYSDIDIQNTQVCLLR